MTCNKMTHLGLMRSRSSGWFSKEIEPSYYGQLIRDDDLAYRFRRGQKAELGERHTGWLFFDFEMIQNPDQKFDWSNNMTLELTDAFDERHSVQGGLLKMYGPR